MLNTVEKGWKEYKLALVYNEKDMETSENGKRRSLKTKKLVGTLAQGYEDLILRLKRAMLESGAFLSKEIVLISDGSEWIESAHRYTFKVG